MSDIWWNLKDAWDWFWYYRHGRVKYWVFGVNGNWVATANDGKASSAACYASTPELAKALALRSLREGHNEK